MKKYIFILTPSLILLATYSYAQDVAKGSSSTGQLSAISIVNSDIHPIKSTVRASHQVDRKGIDSRQTHRHGNLSVSSRLREFL